jgi:hypothetical protein
MLHRIGINLEDIPIDPLSMVGTPLRQAMRGLLARFHKMSPLPMPRTDQKYRLWMRQIIPAATRQ